jgi:hypothetical protein
MNWSTVLGATSGQVSGPVTGSVDGDGVTINSYDNLEGAYNAGYVWSSVYNAWVPSSFATPAGTTTFAGDFNAVTSSTTPTPPYGDNLLGIIAPGGNNPGYADVTMSFVVPLQFIEFQVTAESNVNFVATLVAYDAGHNVLGTYTVNDQGTGGQCNSLNQGPPQPCSPGAPYVQFYDPQDNIASVELTINDTSGAFIDTLSVGEIPEPSTLAMFSLAIVALAWSAKRGNLLQTAKSTTAARD